MAGESHFEWGWIPGYDDERWRFLTAKTESSSNSQRYRVSHSLPPMRDPELWGPWANPVHPRRNRDKDTLMGPKETTTTPALQ